MRYDWLRSDTLAMWLFDGDVSDESANGYHLNEWYGPYDYHIGKFDQCARYVSGTGQDTRREILDGDPIMRTTNFSVCAWLNTGSAAGRQVFMSLAEYYDFSGAWGWMVAITDGFPYFYTAGGHGGQTWDPVDSGRYIADSEWHWVVVTISSNSMVKIYIDGLLCKSKRNDEIGYPSPFSVALSVGQLTITGDNAGGYDKYIGMVQRLALLSTVLSAQEVYRMYAFQMGWL